MTVYQQINDISAFHNLYILIGQMQRKPPERCQKHVTKLSQTDHNFVEWQWYGIWQCNNMFRFILSGNVPFLRADRELISDFTELTSYIEAKVTCTRQTVCL